MDEKILQEDLALLTNIWSKWTDNLTLLQNRLEVESLITKIYKNMNFKKPQIIFTSSPISMLFTINYLKFYYTEEYETFNKNILSNEPYFSPFIDAVNEITSLQIDPSQIKNINLSLENAFSEQLKGIVDIKLNQIIAQKVLNINQHDFRYMNTLWNEFSSLRIRLDFKNYFRELISVNYLLPNKSNNDKSNRILSFTNFGYIINSLNLMINLFNNDNLIFYRYFKRKGVMFIEEIIELLSHLQDECLLFIPFEDICFICDKPSEINFENNDPANIDIFPTMRFKDGCNIWIYRNTRISNIKYHCPTFMWQPEWLLEEENAEIRRILMQGIGPERILSGLGAILLDSYESTNQGTYELYKLNHSIDYEDYIIIKMICPSTGKNYIHRVPPYMKSAREAITWVNGGVDPENFNKVG